METNINWLNSRQKKLKTIIRWLDTNRLVITLSWNTFHSIKKMWIESNFIFVPLCYIMKFQIIVEYFDHYLITNKIDKCYFTKEILDIWMLSLSKSSGGILSCVLLCHICLGYIKWRALKPLCWKSTWLCWFSIFILFGFHVIKFDSFDMRIPGFSGSYDLVSILFFFCFYYFIMLSLHSLKMKWRLNI